MLHAGLDLSRKRLDYCLLDERGDRVEVGAAAADGDSLRGLARRVELRHGGRQPRRPRRRKRFAPVATTASLKASSKRAPEHRDRTRLIGGVHRNRGTVATSPRGPAQQRACEIVPQEEHIAMTKKLRATVTCPACERTATLTDKQIDSRKVVGQWCDGAYGARHPVCQMIGPEGEALA